VLREYLSPEQLKEFQISMRWPRERGLCILCQRASDLDRLARTIKATEDFVFALSLSQLLSHIDMEIVFARLPNLTSLQLTYGVRNVGIKYDRGLFGMKISDAMSLAKCLRASESLTTLSLQCCMIDDDLLRMLMTGLIRNQSITHVDLSHNNITNYGVRLLSKLLGPKSVVAVVNLSDNEVHADGGKYLGRALKKNDSVTDLNLRLNRLDDDVRCVALRCVAWLAYFVLPLRVRVRTAAAHADLCSVFCVLCSVFCVVLCCVASPGRSDAHGGAAVQPVADEPERVVELVGNSVCGGAGCGAQWRCHPACGVGPVSEQPGRPVCLGTFTA
jgi:hypothetical protein